ncbi:PHP-associated domain-containing protein [Chloroflexota bacterium]
MLKADFHIHTRYSMDCDMSLETIIERCQKAGINCIAISDHGTVEGALKMQEMAPFKVIVAEEILTHNGEIMGMFLKETIPSRISVEEAISSIRAQGGLVCLPHPFDSFRGLRLDNHQMEELAGQIDIVEVFNARSPLPGPATKAEAFAAKYDLPGTVGSDSHTPNEIGHTYMEIPEFNDKDEFIQALRKGRITRHRTSPLVHFHTTLTKLRKGFSKG